MPITKKQISLGILLAAAVCAAVYAVGGRNVDDGHRESVRPAAIPDPEQNPEENPPDVRVIGPVPTYWAKTSDFDSASVSASRDSDAALYVPPPIYPLKSKQSEPITAVDAVTALLPGGAVPDVQIEIPAPDPDDPGPPR